jgi:hypothetical protein
LPSFASTGKMTSAWLAGQFYDIISSFSVSNEHDVSEFNPSDTEISESDVEFPEFLVIATLGEINYGMIQIGACNILISDVRLGYVPREFIFNCSLVLLTTKHAKPHNFIIKYDENTQNREILRENSQSEILLPSSCFALFELTAGFKLVWTE